MALFHRHVVLATLYAGGSKRQVDAGVYTGMEPTMVQHPHKPATNSATESSLKWDSACVFIAA